jgi:hypothetical protein
MKKNRQTKSITVSSTRWLAYATAGAASALAAATSAEAEIHYSGPLGVKVDGIQVSLPLSNGASLTFLDFAGGSYYQQFASFFINGVVSGSGRAYFLDDGRNWLLDLNVGSNISRGTFGPVTGDPYRGILKSYLSFHQFEPPDGGILGFRFNTGKGLQYGWARIKPTFFKHDHDVQYRFIIEDYAWGDVGDRIKAGQNHSLRQQADAVSKSGSLGLLAAGATGLEAWRTQRAQLAPAE